MNFSILKYYYNYFLWKREYKKVNKMSDKILYNVFKTLKRNSDSNQFNLSSRFKVIQSNLILSHYKMSDIWIKFRHNFLSKIIYLSNSVISRYFLIISLIVFFGISLSLIVWLIFIWSTLIKTKYTCFLTTCSNHINPFSPCFLLYMSSNTL